MSSVLSSQTVDIYVVAGARPFSIGQAIAEELATAKPESLVVTIDLEPGPSLLPNIVARQFDLNPLHCTGGFIQWSTELHQLLSLKDLVPATRTPVKAVFLTLAKYNVGEYQQMTPPDRADMLGCNVLGKFEVLHAVMRHNGDQNYSNSAGLGVIDFGSLHAVYRTPHRALYSSTKAAGMILCEVLVRGQEVRRAIHVAPGRVDTPMLHWNHWVLKERGQQSFLDLIRHETPLLYGPIFCDCDRSAFDDAVHLLRLEHSMLVETFERYSDRRKVAKETDDGITSPTALAAYLVSKVVGQEDSQSGTLQVTSPQGQLRTDFTAF